MKLGSDSGLLGPLETQRVISVVKAICGKRVSISTSCSSTGETIFWASKSSNLGRFSASSISSCDTGTGVGSSAVGSEGEDSILTYFVFWFTRWQNKNCDKYYKKSINIFFFSCQCLLKKLNFILLLLNYITFCHLSHQV